MHQTKVFEVTQKVLQDSLESTRKVMEQSKKFRHPSRRISRIGSVVGGVIGVILLLVGTIGLLFDKTLWPTSALTVGVLTIFSNIINYNRK